MLHLIKYTSQDSGLLMKVNTWTPKYICVKRHIFCLKLMEDGENGQPGVLALRIVSHSLKEENKLSQKQRGKGEGIQNFELITLYAACLSLLTDSAQIHCQLLVEPSVLRMKSLNGCLMKMLSWTLLPVRVLLILLVQRTPMMMRLHLGVQKTVFSQNGLNGVHVAQHAYHLL